VEFAALRIAALNTLGEFTVARALAQDIDTGNWNGALTDAALDAYIAASDVAGACPAIRLQGGGREDPQRVMWQAICNAYAGEGALAASQLNIAQSRAIAPEIDLLLAQRYAGAAGRGRGGTRVDWDGAEELTPWRMSLAQAVGEDIPEELLDTALTGADGAYYALAGAANAALPMSMRARYAQTAAARGVFSASALVDLYSRLYALEGASGVEAQAAARLREAYVAPDPATRIAAMRGLWGEGESGFAGRVLTAYAAARIAPAEAQTKAADDLIASMLTAGLDRDAAGWRGVVETGSLGWAMLALADPGARAASRGGIDSFRDADESAGQRRSAFLVAGLAGLGRLPGGSLASWSEEAGGDLTRQTRWSRTIARAAEVENAALVALLAGLGMQGDSWAQMTPLHLYHITAALTRVGLEAEARMIAAEAVARA
jgi:hypothetical protein